MPAAALSRSHLTKHVSQDAGQQAHVAPIAWTGTDGAAEHRGWAEPLPVAVEPDLERTQSQGHRELLVEVPRKLDAPNVVDFGETRPRCGKQHVGDGGPMARDNAADAGPKEASNVHQRQRLGERHAVHERRR